MLLLALSSYTILVLEKLIWENVLCGLTFGPVIQKDEIDPPWIIFIIFVFSPTFMNKNFEISYWYIRFIKSQPNVKWKTWANFVLRYYHRPLPYVVVSMSHMCH